MLDAEYTYEGWDFVIIEDCKSYILQAEMDGLVKKKEINFEDMRTMRDYMYLSQRFYENELKHIKTFNKK